MGTDIGDGGAWGAAFESLGGEELHRRLCANLGVGLWLLDQEGYLVSVNTRGAELCGLAPDDLSGRHLSELCVGDLPPAASALLSRAEGASVSTELHISCQDARTPLVHATFSHVSDAANHPVRYAVSLIEVSSYVERITHHRREAEKLGVLLRETHHRVKNNLQVIASLVGLLAGSEEEAPPWVETLEQRIRAVSMVHDTLSASSSPGEVDFGDYLRRMVEQTMSTVGMAPQVDVDIEIDSPRMELSEVFPLGIILSEFLMNSAKYAFADRGGGSVTIRQWEEEGHRVVLEYRDDGPGIPPETAGSPDPASAGIGLEIVGALMEQLNGSVSFGEPPGFSARLHFDRRV